MALQTDAIGLTTLILVLVSWVASGGMLIFRKKSPPAQETKRAPAATWGIALQSASFALVWILPRPLWWPFRPTAAGEIALGAAAVVLAYGSSWLVLQAVRTLGKQWTFQARVIEGHELVTLGPYSLVRNPIYLGMFGAILSVGLAFSRWWTFLAAMVVFLIGNRIRIKAEEKLLRETFGAQFDDYARRVPAFFPRLF
jgi:protein-S-isoprenylcysteine O-methyltransferase Ste14